VISRKRPKPIKSKSLAEIQALRREALSVLFAQLASKDREVKNFREKVLNSKFPLAAKKVENWLKSQDKEDEKNAGESPERGERIDYFVPKDEYERGFYPYKGEKLDHLAKISERLSDTYNWSKAQAVDFVLTGNSPFIPQLDVQWKYSLSLPAASRIVLTVDPAMTAREVAEIYRSARRDMLKKDKKDKARFRLQSEKHLHLAIFDAQQPDGDTYRKKMKAWNDQCPKQWKYTQESNFGRDCKKAIERLLQPDYFDHPLMKG